MPNPLTLYDNYTRSLRPFVPLHPDGDVGLYACGPTVYDYQHIGNFRTFMFVDTLRRVLEWNGYSVKHVMNITDVGHLTSDADTGEDKMEKGSRRTGKSAWEIAQLYTDAFVVDMKRLDIEDADGAVQGDRPHPRADRVHRRHREERLHVPHLRRHLFRHREAERLRLSRAARRQGTGSRQARRARRKAPRHRLRAVEVLATRRETADGVGQPVGQGLSRLAHRVLGDGAEIPRRLSSTSIAAARTTSRSTTRTRSRRPRRGSARASRTSGCTAISCCRTTPRWRSRQASSCASSR